jgi:hypothetical protein
VIMAVRAGALASPVAGLAHYGRAHEHSRGRQSPASTQGALTFPAAGRRLLPSAVLQRSRSESRRASAADPCWRAAPASPWAGCSRLAVSCGAGIAQPGEVCPYQPAEWRLFRPVHGLGARVRLALLSIFSLAGASRPGPRCLCVLLEDTQKYV